MNVQFFVKIMNPFGVVVYIGKGEKPFVFDIDDAMLFDTKDEAKCAISLVKAHERHGRYQKIGKRTTETENAKEFYVFA